MGMFGIWFYFSNSYMAISLLDFTIENTKNKQWIEIVDELPNLQFLDPSGNSRKNDIELKEWIAQGNKIKYLPENSSYETTDFMLCFEARKKELSKKLKEILS